VGVLNKKSIYFACVNIGNNVYPKLPTGA